VRSADSLQDAISSASARPDVTTVKQNRTSSSADKYLAVQYLGALPLTTTWPSKLTVPVTSATEVATAYVTNSPCALIAAIL